MNFKMSSLFSEHRAAQVAAYFLIRATDRKSNISLLKLMKLMYLAERLSYERFCCPIIGDALVSMPHGPVLSRTLDLMNFGSSTENGEWDSFVAEKDGRYMSLNGHQGLTIDDLRELSESDIEVLDSIWGRFGKLSALQLREYTHNSDNCPEWQDPDGSSVPIKLETLLEKLGYSQADIEKAVANTRKQAWINSKLSA
jgi:uncharacterized phage-associated protein